MLHGTTQVCGVTNHHNCASPATPTVHQGRTARACAWRKIDMDKLPGCCNHWQTAFAVAAMQQMVPACLLAPLSNGGTASRKMLSPAVADRLVPTPVPAAAATGSADWVHRSCGSATT